MSNPFASTSYFSNGSYYWYNVDSIFLSAMPKDFRGKLTGNETEALRKLLHQLWERALAVGEDRATHRFQAAEDSKIEQIADERARAKLGWVLDNWNNLEASE